MDVEKNGCRTKHVGFVKLVLQMTHSLTDPFCLGSDDVIDTLCAVAAMERMKTGA